LTLKTFVVVENNYDLSGDFDHFKGYKVIYAGTEQTEATQLFNSLDFGNMTVWEKGLLTSKHTKKNGKIQ